MAVEKEPEVQRLKQSDQEEFLYREALLTQFVNLSILLLKYSPQSEHPAVYDLLGELFEKAAADFDLAESLTTLEGI